MLRRVLKVTVLIALILVSATVPLSSKSLIEALQPTANSEPKLIERGEFRTRFRDNPSLELKDFDVFPAEFRGQLGINTNWRSGKFSAFSKEIRHWTFLVVVTDTQRDYYSSAVILNWRNSSRPLMKVLNLPNLKQLDGGWSLVVTDRHAWLKWNENIDAVQVTYCSDIATSSCIRHTTKIDWFQQELLMVEIDRSRTHTDWEPIWKSGRWLINPEKVDFDTR